MLWRLCGEGSRQCESGLTHLIDIAGAGHGLAIQGDTFRQEGSGGELQVGPLDARQLHGCGFSSLCRGRCFAHMHTIGHKLIEGVHAHCDAYSSLHMEELDES